MDGNTHKCSFSFITPTLTWVASIVSQQKLTDESVSNSSPAPLSTIIPLHQNGSIHGKDTAYTFTNTGQGWPAFFSWCDWCGPLRCLLGKAWRNLCFKNTLQAPLSRQRFCYSSGTWVYYNEPLEDGGWSKTLPRSEQRPVHGALRHKRSIKKYIVTDFWIRLCNTVSISCSKSTVLLLCLSLYSPPNTSLYFQTLKLSYNKITKQNSQFRSLFPIILLNHNWASNFQLLWLNLSHENSKQMTRLPQVEVVAPLVWTCGCPHLILEWNLLTMTHSSENSATELLILCLHLPLYL